MVLVWRARSLPPPTPDPDLSTLEGMGEASTLARLLYEWWLEIWSTSIFGLTGHMSEILMHDVFTSPSPDEKTMT